ncbi:metacaspase-3-like isoform X2 [Trifolium pratense]|nr:metacaspase-3-like isoform X2 [Trifolium pratense]
MFVFTFELKTCLYIYSFCFAIVAYILIIMGDRLKARKSKSSYFPFTRNSTDGACFDHHKFLSSKHTMEKELACIRCKRKFVVPTKIGTYRCCECQGVSKSISGYKQLRENSLGAKFFNQDQLHNASTNATSFSSPLLSTTPTGNKRAVLCGVSYSRRRYRLKGTVNDVVNMNSLLVENFAFPIQSIRVLTEEQKDPNLIPTRRNIVESLKWLVKDCQSGDSLVFYFSGHGMQQLADDKEDEIDGLDETICPVDFIREGMITDNEINSTIVEPLKNGVKLHAIIDACHSGTTLDLMHVYKKDNGNWKWMNNNPPGTEPVTKRTNGGTAICFSACEDSQLAADTAAFGGKEMNGVMTYLLAKIIREHSGITYASLLEKLHEDIAKIQRSKHFSGFLRRIFHRRIDQDPLLSASEKFDVRTRILF